MLGTLAGLVGLVLRQHGSLSSVLQQAAAAAPTPSRSPRKGRQRVSAEETQSIVSAVDDEVEDGAEILEPQNGR